MRKAAANLCVKLLDLYPTLKAPVAYETPKQAKLFALTIDNDAGLHQSIHTTRANAEHELFVYVSEQWRDNDGPIPEDETEAVNAYFGEGGRGESDSERAEITECEVEA